MYQYPLVYDKTFDTSYLPTCMYSVQPYYDQQTGDANKMSTEAIVLPTELPKFDGFNLEDEATKRALEDVLSRQMLLLCRINELEQRLVGAAINATIGQQRQQQQQVKVVDVSNNSLELDLTVHFELERPPYVLFALLRLLGTGNGPKIMANLHVAGTLASQRHIDRRLAALRGSLAETIGFRFTTSEDYVSRSQFPIKVTFIAKASSSGLPYGLFGSQLKAPVVGELSIVAKLLSLLGQPTNTPVWRFLFDQQQLLTSDRECIGQLAPLVAQVTDDKSFAAGGETPSALDVVLWALATFSGQSPATPVAKSFKSLFGVPWAQAVQQLFASN